MEFLPDEILSQILFYLHPIYEDLASYSLISRKWDHIIQTTGFLWRHIHLDDDGGAHGSLEEDYVNVLRNCLNRFGHFIKCIRAADHTFFTRRDIRRLLLPLPNLVRLDIPMLSWSRVFAQSLKSAPVLKFLTIDDYRALAKRSSGFTGGHARIHKRGIRVWDLRVLARQFTSLESLSLNINIFKLCRHGIIPVLDQLNLKELHLECAPYGIDELPPEYASCLPPIKALMNSRHSAILISLDLHFLPVTVGDLVSYVGKFNSLKQLVVAVTDQTDNTARRSLFLESRSLTTLFLTGLPSIHVSSLRCVMPSLEVLLIAGCHYLTSLEVHATNILSFILKGNCLLTNVMAYCTSILDVLIYDCPTIEPESLKAFLLECPDIRQMELSLDWDVFELDSNHCRNLKQLTIRDITMSLSKLTVDCPTLEYFKCSGELCPEKGKNNKDFAGCDLELRSNSFKRIQICDVGNANRVTVHSVETAMIQITGIQPWQRPLNVELNATRGIDTVYLTGLTIGVVAINASSVENVIIEGCSLAHWKKQCKLRFKCDVIRALRLLRCSRI